MLRGSVRFSKSSLPRLELCDIPEENGWLKVSLDKGLLIIHDFRTEDVLYRERLLVQFLETYGFASASATQACICEHTLFNQLQGE